MESIHFDPYLYWRFTYTWIALRMLMLDGIHQNNVRFFAIYPTCVSCHCRLCVVSVLGSDREEILLCARCPHEGSGSTVWEKTMFSTASVQPPAN